MTASISVAAACCLNLRCHTLREKIVNKEMPSRGGQPTPNINRDLALIAASGVVRRYCQNDRGEGLRYFSPALSSGLIIHSGVVAAKRTRPQPNAISNIYHVCDPTSLLHVDAAKCTKAPGELKSERLSRLSITVCRTPLWLA